MKTDGYLYSLILVLAFGLIVPYIWAAGGSLDCQAASARAIEFVRNAHSGKRMAAEEWMTATARQAPMFANFGGLDALVDQTTRRAGRYGGLKSVKAISVKRVGDECLVGLDVQFVADPRVPTTPAIAEREDMVWTLKVARVKGSWKISG